MASLLPLILSPADLLAEGRADEPHAEWLQSMLRTEASEGFYEALAHVEGQEFATQQAFLVAFVRAFEARGSGEQLAPLFTHISVSNDELILLLQGRLTGIGADAFTIPASLRAALAHVAPVHSRDFAAQRLITARPRAHAFPFVGEDLSVSSETAAGWLTSRQPNGP